MNKLAIDQVGLTEYVKNLPKYVQITLSLLCCALAAYYVPLLIVVFTGHWASTLTASKGLAVAMTILMIQNLLGNAIKHILRTGCVFAAIVFCFFASAIAIRTSWKESVNLWYVMFFPVAVIMLNTLMFLKLRRKFVF